MTEKVVTTSAGIDSIVLDELPIRPAPMLKDFIKVEGTMLVINPNGTACDPITDGRTAKAYAYAASRLIAQWYISLAPRRHLFHPATGPLTLNRGVYKDVASGKWYFLDSMDGRYIATTREVKPASRVEAHEFNDQLATYRLEISLTRRDGEWYNWSDVLVECLGAKDRSEANDILNRHIREANERKEEWRATGKAVRDGNNVEIKAVIVNGVDLMQFQAGTVWDKTVNRKFSWSSKDAYAVIRTSGALSKGHELEFVPPQATIA